MSFKRHRRAVLGDEASAEPAASVKEKRLSPKFLLGLGVTPGGSGGLPDAVSRRQHPVGVKEGPAAGMSPNSILVVLEGDLKAKLAQFCYFQNPQTFTPLQPGFCPAPQTPHEAGEDPPPGVWGPSWVSRSPLPLPVARRPTGQRLVSHGSAPPDCSKQGPPQAPYLPGPAVGPDVFAPNHTRNVGHVGGAATAIGLKKHRGEGRKKRRPLSDLCQ